MRHHAIIITTWSDDLFNEAMVKAQEIFNPSLVSNAMRSIINGYKTFCIAPDGSKEGWEDSTIGDSNRAAFILWMKEKEYDDGSSPFDWCEIQYGDDERDNRVLQCST